MDFWQVLVAFVFLILLIIMAIGTFILAKEVLTQASHIDIGDAIRKQVGCTIKNMRGGEC